MNTAEIITKTVGSGTIDNPFMPQLTQDYNFNMSDYTGVYGIGVPNSIVIRCNLTAEQLQIIESDNNYYILWDIPNPKPPDGTPSADEWARLNAFLASQGYTPQERRDAIGITPHGRSRMEIGNGLIGWLKDRKP